MGDSTKIQFYDPDVGYENLWATDIGNGLYRIKSVPFFIYGISVGDVVSAKPDSDGRLQFVAVERTSKNRTLRARAQEFDVSDQRCKDLTRELNSLGCTAETLKPRVIAISIPSEVDLQAVTNLLNSEGIAWEYANPTYDEVNRKPS
jgi:Domain of unknown function (DUF4265)